MPPDTSSRRPSPRPEGPRGAAPGPAPAWGAIPPLIRAAFLVVTAALGLLWAEGAALPLPLGAGAALACGGAALALEAGLRRIPAPTLLRAVAGALAGALAAELLMRVLWPGGAVSPARGLAALAAIYLGGALAVTKLPEVSLAAALRRWKEAPRAESHKILDTSVIIDGRVADVVEAGFLEGTLVVPPFVLRELQHIADSSDPLKRNRGRRGLDILQKLQKKPGLRVEIREEEYPEVRDVDAKLVALAKALGGAVVTNDLNLTKVCELHGVRVLNVNELTAALRPVVLPGEDMRVTVLKEGKEVNQGVAYLDDGTMVVVDNGRRHIGQTIDVCVTSVLQTAAGRMIFSRLKEEAEAAA